MKILVSVNKVIVAISEEMEVVENGILVGDVVYGEPTLTIHEVDNIPQEVKPQAYKHVNGEFVVNPDYQEFIDTNKVVKDLKLEVAYLWYEIMMLGGM